MLHLIAASTGVGKTTALATEVAKRGGTIWLSDRHEQVEQVVNLIRQHGGSAARVVTLEGSTDGVANCIKPTLIRQWQAKGYNYPAGVCRAQCPRRGRPRSCPFLASLKGLEEADNVVLTKALASSTSIFWEYGNQERKRVVIDEDPVGLLRPLVQVTRKEILHLLKYLDAIDAKMRARGDGNSADVLRRSAECRRLATWAADQMATPKQAPTAVHIDNAPRPTKPAFDMTKAAARNGRKRFNAIFQRHMRRRPRRSLRNVPNDLFGLFRAASKHVYITTDSLCYHIRVRIPRDRQVIIADATVDPALIAPLFPRHRVEVIGGEQIKPVGRIIQLMDSNGPRSYLNKIPKKTIRIIDAIGDLHQDGKLVLISHKSCVKELADASRHKDRIVIAHFGAIRGRNDLEPTPASGIVAHIVVGSPKTTEEDRQRLALAIYGTSIMPFATDLVDVRRAVRGLVPPELSEDGDQKEAIWEVRLKGYADPRMQRIYEHSVTAELTHAADRARVLVHHDAIVYLVTNEPCPKQWFAEMCFAAEMFDLSARRADFSQATSTYEAAAKRLLNDEKAICNADVCRALGRAVKWGSRYWRTFVQNNRDTLEGDRKLRWKPRHGT